MMKKTTYIMISLAVAMFAAAGCSKQEAGTDGKDCPMTIQPEVVSADGALKSDDGGATKATLINDATGLRSQGFGLSIYNGTTAYKSNVSMVYSGGAWTHPSDATDWKWPAGTAYSFYAWSPSTLNVGTVTGTGVPAFTYSGITGQQDIMLGYYGGLGDNGAAPVKFSHALASVQFKTGTITGLGNITKIELSGVATSGTCTPSYSSSSTVGFAWSNFSGSTAITQTGLTVATTASGTAIGKPFLTLPQSAALTVKLTDANSKTITATISAPALTVGKTAVYTINYDGQTASFTVSIEDWDNGQSDEVTVGEESKGIEIKSIDDLMAFKSKVQDGENLMGITVYFTKDVALNMANPLLGISDPGVLDGVTIDGQGHSLGLGEGGQTLPFFLNISSDDVTIRNLTIRGYADKLHVVAPNAVGVFIGTSSGSNLTLDNCSSEDVHIEGIQDITATTGGLIGECVGNAVIKDCSIRNGMCLVPDDIIVGGFIGSCAGDLEMSDCSINNSIINTNGYYQSFILGKADGGDITMDNLTVNGCEIRCAKNNKMFGVYIGALENCQGMTISLTKCTTDANDARGSFPSITEGYTYYHTGSGKNENVECESYHFYAIACNGNTTEYAKANVSMTEMNHCGKNGFPQ